MMLPALPAVPRTQLAIATLVSVVALVLLDPNAPTTQGLCDVADNLLARCFEGGSLEEQLFSQELSDWHARAV